MGLFFDSFTLICNKNALNKNLGFLRGKTLDFLSNLIRDKKSPGPKLDPLILSLTGLPLELLDGLQVSLNKFYLFKIKSRNDIIEHFNENFISAESVLIHM